MGLPFKRRAAGIGRRSCSARRPGGGEIARENRYKRGRQNKGPDAGPPRLGQKGIAPITVTCFDQIPIRNVLTRSATWRSCSAAVR